MLVVETVARIRREHIVKGKTIKEIARDLGVSRNTVRRVLRSGETSFEYGGRSKPRPKLGRWTAELDELLGGNAATTIPKVQCSGMVSPDELVPSFPPGVEATNRPC
jgi:predicted transcriptional regulator